MNIEQLQQCVHYIEPLVFFKETQRPFSITPKLLEFTFTVRRSVRRLLNSGAALVPRAGVLVKQSKTRIIRSTLDALLPK